MTAYYNEIDPFCVEWLKNLIAAGLIAPGDVDDRDIRDVSPDDLRGYDQCHFFAGIGVWSYALRQAGWPDDRPVWTGSCPCQPFSAAGKGAGFDDERHLWPAFFHLIEQCQPSTVFGEQVASKDGLAWLDLVYADMEGAGYAFASLDLCAAGVGAPHPRQRLYFVGDSASNGREQRWQAPSFALQGKCSERTGEHTESPESGVVEGRPEGLGGGSLCGVADSDHGPSPRIREHCWPVLSNQEAERLGVGGMVGGAWRDAEWLWGRDEKFRPVEPGTEPLVDGPSQVVGRLRAYGNAIVQPLAKEFVAAFLQSESDSLKVN